MFKNILLAVAILFTSMSSAEEHAISVSYIQGEGDVKGLKLGYQYYLDVPEKFDPNLKLYLESSINFWEYGEHNSHDTNFVLALSPVIQYPLTTVAGHTIYGEFGIGLSILDDTQFAGKNVSTHFQFEDRLGLVTYFGKQKEHAITLRYFHYSNGGIKKPNPGLDFIALTYTRML